MSSKGSKNKKKWKAGEEVPFPPPKFLNGNLPYWFMRRLVWWEPLPSVAEERTARDQGLPSPRDEQRNFRRWYAHQISRLPEETLDLLRKHSEHGERLAGAEAIDLVNAALASVPSYEPRVSTGKSTAKAENARRAKAAKALRLSARAMADAPTLHRIDLSRALNSLYSAPNISELDRSRFKDWDAAMGSFESHVDALNLHGEHEVGRYGRAAFDHWKSPRFRFRRSTISASDLLFYFDFPLHVLLRAVADEIERTPVPTGGLRRTGNALAHASYEAITLFFKKHTGTGRPSLSKKIVEEFTGLEIAKENLKGTQSARVNKRKK